MVIRILEQFTSKLIQLILTNIIERINQLIFILKQSNQVQNASHVFQEVKITLLIGTIIDIIESIKLAIYKFIRRMHAIQ